MNVESLPRPVSMVSQGTPANRGHRPAERRRHAPRAHAPATGPAITRERSSTRIRRAGARLPARLASPHRSSRSSAPEAQRALWHAASPPFSRERMKETTRRRHRPRSRRPRHPTPSAPPGSSRAPARKPAPCRRRRGDGRSWCAAAHSAIARAVDAGGRVARRRRLRRAQVALGAAFDDGVKRVDRDLLRLTLRSFQISAAASLRLRSAPARRPRRERRTAKRLVAGQRDGVQRGRFATGEAPEVSEDGAGSLHVQLVIRGLDPLLREVLFKA